MRSSTSIKPLQSVIVPSSVNISETPLSAEFSSADAAEGARFVSSASISDSVVRMKNTLPIILLLLLYICPLIYGSQP